MKNILPWAPGTDKCRTPPPCRDDRHSMLVAAVTVGLGGAGLLRHLDEPLHSGVVVPGLQAGEVHLAGLGEAPHNLAGLAGRHADHVVVGVFHARHLQHHRVVLLQFLGRAQHQLVLNRAGVLHDEAHRLTLPDRDLGRGEAHVVGHVNVDRARDLGGFAGHADGVAVAVAVSVAVGSFGGGRGSGMVYAVMGLAGEGGERDKRGCDGDERLFHGNSLLN
mmetsp:Transcript_5433/g.20735  ORF Transcript_5433/g.20735 Transcript_5433/m.20735 type:complete len:220 (-) Transcript_5433:553-1212(-)